MTGSDWHLEAACAGQPSAVFFPKGDTGPNGERDVYAPARAICAGCPVRAQCLDEALSLPDSEAQGMWGGMDEKERRAERRRRGIKTPRVVKWREHGTVHCYDRGPHTGAAPCRCPACVRAKTAKTMEYRDCKAAGS